MTNDNNPINLEDSISVGKVRAGHYWCFYWVGRISRPVAGLVVTGHCRSDDIIVQDTGTLSIVNIY